MRRLLTYLLLIFVASCAPSPDGNPYSDEGTWDDGVTTIAELKSMYKGSTARISDQIMIEGVVTANDIRGEFTDLIIVEDASGAVEIWMDLDHGYESYPLGSSVVCNCAGLYIGSNYGAIVLGDSPASDEVVGVLYDDEYYWRVVAQGVTSSVTPKSVTISELSSWMTSTYISLSGVRVISDERYYCAIDSETGRRKSTIHTLEDALGNTISMYVSGDCDYGSEMLPDEEFSVAGILTGYGSYYSITVVDHRIY